MKYSHFLIVLLYLFTGCSNETSTHSPTEASADANSRQLFDAMVDAQPIDATTVDISDAAPIQDTSTPESDQEIIDMTVVDAEVPMPCAVQFDIRSPSSGRFIYAEDGVDLRGFLRSTESGETLYGELIIRDSNGETIETITTSPSGQFDLSLSIDPMNARVSFEIGARIAGQLCTEVKSFDLTTCGRRYREDFAVLSDQWRLFGDAFWDEGGWIDVTGNESFKKGAAYNPFNVISRGQSSIRFTIITGGGQASLGGGGDGYALSIVEPIPLETFEQLLTAAYPGGGLGYAVAGNYAGDDFEFTSSMFTIEVDTYYNAGQGQNWHVDPTNESHIEITRNGDPGASVTFHEVPSIEDLEPHQIQVDILPDRLKIYLDGALVVEHDESLIFKGGYLFFSGSTGAATNYHRINSVEILHECF